MTEIILSLTALIITALMGFWIGCERGLARGVRYGYAAGLKYARNTLRRR